MVLLDLEGEEFEGEEAGLGVSFVFDGGFG